MHEPETEGRVGAGAARNRRRWLAVVLLFFGVSRIAFFALGVRFNAEGLIWYWQILDPELLRSDPLGSVMLLHVQPPLFNLFLGLVLAAFPIAAVGVMNGVFLLMSGSLVVVVFFVLLEVGWPARAAALLVAVLMLSPGWLMYESWLFYDFPTAFLLAIATFALLRCGRSGLVPWLAVFVWSICGLALMRSLFHLIWLVAAMAVLTICRVGVRRQWIAIALLPVALVAALYVKNLVAFGFFGPSSWLGMSVAKMTVARLDPGERNRMVGEGELSPYALVPPFSPLEAYEKMGGTTFLNPEQPALGQRIKSTGQPNFNHLAYGQVSRVLRKDALVVAKTRPELYQGAVGLAWRRFFSPVVAYPAFSDNLLVIAPIFRLSQATFGRPIFAAGCFFAATLICGFGWWRARSRGDRGLEAAAAFVLLNLLWIAVVGNLLEVGENHRFRFLVTPLVWFSMCAAVAPWFGKRAGRS